MHISVLPGLFACEISFHAVFTMRVLVPTSYTICSYDPNNYCSPNKRGDETQQQ